MKAIFKLLKNAWISIRYLPDDLLWWETGGSCFGLFPPSFYHKHTPEEVEQIKAETLKQIREAIDKLED